VSETAPALGLTTAAARVILGNAADTAGRADYVAARLGEAIRLGLLLDGERLPSEARLAEQFGVATVTLREALAVLRAEGMVVTRRGRGGGSFVRAQGAEAPGAVPARLRQLSMQALRELGDHRAAISGTAARLAAERALPEEVEGLRAQAGRLRTAETVSERRRADTQFTLGVAAAAQSTRLTGEEMRLLAELGDLLWFDLGETEHDQEIRLRLRLVDAIAARNGRRAQELAERHVAAGTDRLLRLRLSAIDAASAPLPQPLAELDATLARIFGGLDALAREYAELVADAAGDLAREDLAALRAGIAALLAEHRRLVSGAGVIVAPGLLTDAPYWLEWWWTRASGVPEALRVNLDPTAPDFFDYTAADWYSTPERTAARHVAGPYVDYICTNEYAVTLVVPVSAAGALIGVAAADVPVSRLERQALPALRALPGPTALVNPAGRVVASNSSSLAPGLLVPPGDADEAAPVLPTTAWRLVAVPRGA
jgi:DNA-binding FadR family transcriptional regulator